MFVFSAWMAAELLEVNDVLETTKFGGMPSKKATSLEYFSSKNPISSTGLRSTCCSNSECFGKVYTTGS